MVPVPPGADQAYVYGVAPPEVVTLVVPVFNPQLAGVLVAVGIMGGGAVITAVVVIVHPNESVIVTV